MVGKIVVHEIACPSPPRHPLAIEKRILLAGPAREGQLRQCIGSIAPQIEGPRGARRIGSAAFYYSLPVPVVNITVARGRRDPVLGVIGVGSRTGLSQVSRSVVVEPSKVVQRICGSVQRFRIMLARIQSDIGQITPGVNGIGLSPIGCRGSRARGVAILNTV